MVFINLPPNLTEEEEVLRQKFARLRKKKKQLQALKAIKPEREPVKEKPVKRPSESAEDAKEQAKKLVKCGLIKLSDKSGRQQFKRSRNLEKKRQDPDVTPQPMVGFTPFAPTQSADDKEEREEKRPRPGRVRGGLYDNFVKGDRKDRPDRGGPGGDREDMMSPEDRGPIREWEEKPEGRFRGGPDRERRERPDREPLPKKGNTVYVFGHGITEDILKKAFSNIGNIVNISMEKERNCGFVTFEKMESSESAIQELTGAMIDGVQLRVSMARRQPSFDNVTADQSTSSWSSIATNNSQKGSHKDKRAMVNYEDDFF